MDGADSGSLWPWVIAALAIVAAVFAGLSDWIA